MDKVFFKVVIPNYNNMAYLKECLDSILNQTFQDFKIIFVDDISTDFSYEFAKMYERKYPNKLVVLKAQEKKYAGGCRNIGIDYPLDCEYYYFIDSDDYLYSNDALQKIYSELGPGPDLLLMNWGMDFNGIIKINKFKMFSEYKNKLAQSPWNSAWSKIIRSSVIEKFLENCMRGEDTYQMLKIMDKAPAVKQTKTATYIYRQIKTSTVHQPIFKEHRPIFINALVELKKCTMHENIIKSINRRLGE